MQHLCDLQDVMPYHWSPGAFPTPVFNVIPHPSVSYCQVFKPILYFQPSSLQSDSRHCPNPYLGKQRISLAVVIIPSICLCPHTYFDCNQFAITSRFVFIYVKTAKVLLVVKTLIKNIEQQPHYSVAMKI